jgi:mRNA interferase HicA
MDGISRCTFDAASTMSLGTATNFTIGGQRGFRLDIRTVLSDICSVKPADLLRRLKRLASRKGWEIDVQDGASHTKVILQGRRTIISRHASDLKTGTFKGILKQLGVSERDLLGVSERDLNE